MCGVTVLNLHTLSDHGLHLYQVQQNYLERFQSYRAVMISILIITKGHDSVKIAHGVTIFIPCTSSTHGLHVLPSLAKISRTVSE